MGHACARRVRGTVDHLIVSDLHDTVDDVARDLDAIAVRCDVSDRADVERLATAAAAQGPLRALVHAAGISPTMNDWQAMVRVDLIGTAHVVAAFTPHVGAGSAAVCFASSA